MGKKYRIAISPDAEKVLDDIYKYIGELSVSAVLKLEREITRALSYLVDNPRIYPESKHVPGMRKCLVKKYIVFYDIIEAESMVYITHIMHGSQNY